MKEIILFFALLFNYSFSAIPTSRILSMGFNEIHRIKSLCDKLPFQESNCEIIQCNKEKINQTKKLCSDAYKNPNFYLIQKIEEKDKKPKLNYNNYDKLNSSKKLVSKFKKHVLIQEEDQETNQIDKKFEDYLSLTKKIQNNVFRFKEYNKKLKGSCSCSNIKDRMKSECLSECDDVTKYLKGVEIFYENLKKEANILALAKVDKLKKELSEI